MKFTTYIAAAIAALGLAAPLATQASSTGTLSAQATISSSATLTLTNPGGIVNSLTFAGVGGATLPATEGTITVHAQITTDATNAATVITVSSTDLTGSTNGGTIPAGALSWTHASDTGGGTWSAGTMTTTPATLASLPSSGTYTGDQTYQLAVPANASADTYTGTVTYAITGF